MSSPQSARTLAIILNWRQPAVTLECVQALRAMREPLLDILVIDNGSADHSLSLLEQLQEGFRLLPLAENRGFAAANNQGLQMALDEGYDYALMVNNDAFAAPDMLAHLMAETAPDIALLSPKIYYEAQPERIWFANGRMHPLTLDLRDTGQGQLDGPHWAANRDVDYLLGTCLLVNLPLVGEEGLLDERYFFYFEDLDWSIRLRQAGYRLRLVADAHLAHRVGLSTGADEDSPLRRYYLGRPRLIFAFRMLSAIKMLTRLILSGRWPVATAYLRGLRHGWRDS